MKGRNGRKKESVTMLCCAVRSIIDDFVHAKVRSEEGELLYCMLAPNICFPRYVQPCSKPNRKEKLKQAETGIAGHAFEISLYVVVLGISEI